MEARAIPCFNKGNLIFKNSNPKGFKGKYADNRLCTFDVCKEHDSYWYVRYDCKLNLVALNQEIRKRYH